MEKLVRENGDAISDDVIAHIVSWLDYKHTENVDYALALHNTFISSAPVREFIELSGNQRIAYPYRHKIRHIEFEAASRHQFSDFPNATCIKGEVEDTDVEVENRYVEKLGIRCNKTISSLTLMCGALTSLSIGRISPNLLEELPATLRALGVYISSDNDLEPIVMPRHLTELDKLSIYSNMESGLLIPDTYRKLTKLIISVMTPRVHIGAGSLQNVDMFRATLMDNIIDLDDSMEDMMRYNDVDVYAPFMSTPSSDMMPKLTKLNYDTPFVIKMARNEKITDLAISFGSSGEDDPIDIIEYFPNVATIMISETFVECYIQDTPQLAEVMIDVDTLVRHNITLGDGFDKDKLAYDHSMPKHFAFYAADPEDEQPSEEIIKMMIGSLIHTLHTQL
jgi:hypothetical protein